MFEARNFVCAHIKRNDPVSRRFIQYLAMQTNTLCVLVRDAKTAQILVKPPEEELWLLREKAGVGRAVKKIWNIVKKVGLDFFKEMDHHRKWHFGFPDYYDVYVWDLEAGNSYSHLYGQVQEVSISTTPPRNPPFVGVDTSLQWKMLTQLDPYQSPSVPCRSRHV